MTEEEMNLIIIEGDVFETLLGDPEWYTVEEVAERLKVKVSTVRDWLRAAALRLEQTRRASGQRGRPGRWVLAR